MSAPATPRIDEDDLQELFGALANEIRLRILFELWRGDTDGETEVADETSTDGGTTVADHAMSFSALQDAVGVKDGGQFNYHLGKLMGRFIERTDRGYTHLASGRALYQTMVASVALDETDIGPLPVGTACHVCGSGLTATYRHQVFDVSCPDCGEPRMRLPFLPAGVDGRSDDERLHAFDRVSRRIISLASDGICPWCLGRLSVEPLDDAERHCFGVRHECARCEARFFTSIGEAVHDHPAIVSFYYDHGLDIDSIPLWDLPFTAADEHHVVSDAPWRAEVVVELENEQLVLSVSDRLEVVDSERRARSEP